MTNDPRSTGWEYYGLTITPIGTEPVTLAVIMREAAQWGRPEHGGWELLLPFLADTPEEGCVTILLKRPISTLVQARTEIPAPFLATDQQVAAALEIATTLAAYGRKLLAEGLPRKLVAALVLQAGDALWSVCDCEEA